MSQSSRKIEFDVEALVLLGVCIFIWLSLLTHSPADPIGELPRWLSYFIAFDNNVYPLNASLQNACGWFGAIASASMLQSLGVGAYLVATGLTVLAAWMFKVQSNYVRGGRQVGWSLVIVAVSTFFALHHIQFPHAPVIGSGGYVGAMTSTWLNEHFALLGSSILTLTVLVAGLLLSTDYVFVRALVWLISGGATVAATTAAAARKRVSLPSPEGLLKLKRRTDVDHALQLATGTLTSDEPVLPIRIRGKDLSAESSAAPGKVETAKSDATKGLLPLAKSIASGLMTISGAEAASASVADTSTAAPAEASDQDVSGDELWDEAAAEDDTSEFREVDVEGETLQVRSDEQDAVPEPNSMKIRPPKSKQVAKKPDDSLAHLDDTKLPAGSEEYVLPGLDLLTESDDIDFEAQTLEVRRKAKILEETFKNFGLNVKVVEVETGPVIAQYEIELEAGLRLSKVTSLADDLAIALRVPSVRIVAPIPGKNSVGIEVPNETRQVVRLREVIEEQGPKGRKAKIPLFLGKDVSGNALTADLATLPHLLIAGRTGTGKSVCLNAIIASILMTRRPDEVRMLMIDPKMVELSGYGRLPHLMHPVVTDMKKAEAILAWAVDKMEERYALLARAGVRHLTSYNELGREELMDRLKPETPEETEAIPDHLPFIVIVADEMADLMMTAGKEVEQHIIRLAQKSRAVGIHLILATQKPTVDVITGLIKSNLPARISFQVASRTDSRVVLDEMGADKLLGNGDMLFLWPGTSMLLRGQGTYLSDEEINAIVDHCSTGEQNFVNELVNLKVREEEGEGEPTPGILKKRDELYAAAVDVVVREGRGSCSLLQRALGIGYGRAARLIDFMAEDGIVGQYNGSQAREVVISISDWEAMQSASEGAAPPTAPPRSNKIRPHEAPSNSPASANKLTNSPLPSQSHLTHSVEAEDEEEMEPQFAAHHSEDSAHSSAFEDDVEYEDYDD